MRGIWLALCLLCTCPALAQDVTLTARDGGLSIDGTLIAFDGAFYRIDTQYGAVTVDAEGVVCSGPACPDLTAPFAAIRIAAASPYSDRLLPRLIEAFVADRGYQREAAPSADGWSVTVMDGTAERRLATFTLVPVGDGAAGQAVLGGLADAALAAAVTDGLNTRTLATEAIVPVVAPDNPLPRITTRDLARILTGDVTNWAEVGGIDMPIALHALPPDADLQVAISARLGREVEAAVTHPTMADLIDAVAQDPYALALTVGIQAAPARALTLTDSCGFVLDPAPLHVKAGDYPLTLPFHALTPPRRLPLILREFLDYAGSTQAQPAIADAGFVARVPEETALLTDDGRLAAAVKAAADTDTMAGLKALGTAMEDARRLSLTFRIDPDTGALDPLSRQNLTDLATYLEAGLYDHQSLLLAGFSDGEDGDEAALAAAQDAADQLSAALAEAAPDSTVPVAVQSFGDVLPVACDTTPIGRQLNRRVEVWLRPTDTPQPEN
jgi:phosphate transport system substrate-binding protein